MFAEIRAMELAKTPRYARVAGALAAFVLFALGCAGTTPVAATTTYPTPAVVYDYPVTYVETVPDLQYYPRTYYRGDYAYLVNGRWYYQTRGRWVVFREEPRELYRYRVYEYDRLEPPQRVRGAEYGTVPQSRPRYDEPAQPVPEPRDRYHEAPAPAPAPQSVPTQRGTPQPAPPPSTPPPRHYERY
jgi:hypothetical protein